MRVAEDRPHRQPEREPAVFKEPEEGPELPLLASQKKALIDGANFACNTIAPFGRGCTGIISLKVAKDRGASLRQYANGSEVAQLKLISLADGSVRHELLPPTSSRSQGGGFVPTRYAESVCAQLALATEPLSRKKIEDAVGGSRQWIRMALRLLIANGYVEALPGRWGPVHGLVPGKVYSPSQPLEPGPAQVLELPLPENSQ